MVTEVIASSGVRTERFTVAGKPHSPLIICLCRTMRRSLAGRIGGYCLVVLLLGDLGWPATRGRTDTEGAVLGGWSREPGRRTVAAGRDVRPGGAARITAREAVPGRTAADSAHLPYREHCSATLATISAAAKIVGETSPIGPTWARTVQFSPLVGDGLRSGRPLLEGGHGCGASTVHHCVHRS